MNVCTKEGSILEDWRTGLIVLMWKRKGDAQDLGKYKGIILLSHIIKLLERILNGRTRKSMETEIGEEQQGFRKARG